MLTDVEGVRVGHWTDHEGETGCTAVLLPAGSVASGEVRGGAPATREFALLEPHRKVTAVNAVMLCGGSAFGLAACDGAVSYCEERGLGWPTLVGPVPIVVGLALFDLAAGDPRARPDAAAGRAACEGAVAGPFETGAIGAGCGARVGFARERRGGIGTATQRQGDLVVSALFVVNAVGYPADQGPAPLEELADLLPPPVEHTVIGVVATNGRLDPTACFTVASGGHDGIARAVDPPHTSADGDAVVVAATGQIDAPADIVKALAVRASHAAVQAGFGT